MKRYKPYFNEDITIPLNPGDKFYFGKFKNKTAVYDSHYINDKGDLIIKTDMGREISACKIRLMQEAFKNLNKQQLQNILNIILDDFDNYLNLFKKIEKYTLNWKHQSFSKKEIQMLRIITNGITKLPTVIYRSISFSLKQYKNGEYNAFLQLKKYKSINDYSSWTSNKKSTDYFTHGGVVSNTIKSILIKSDIFIDIGALFSIYNSFSIYLDSINNNDYRIQKLQDFISDTTLYDENEFLVFNIKEIEHLKESVQFSENLRFTDLMKKASLSPFTLDYNKETNKLMGPPTTHTKLKGIRVNKKKDYVIFVWKTKRTPKYDKKQPMKAVDPKNNFEMKNANFYTIEIKVLDFFKLLKTKPDNNFTNKDIEEVFNVADIQVWSSVPAYQFQGMNYNMTLFDAAIYPELRPPKVWNDIVSQYGKTHNEYQFLDKHTAGVVNSIKFYIPQMRQMIKRYLDN